RGLARAVDVSASLISQIETGKSSPSVSTLYAITAALDISIEDVFGGGSPNRGDAANGAPETADLAAAAAAVGAREIRGPAGSARPIPPGPGDPPSPVDRSSESVVN